MRIRTDPATFAAVVLVVMVAAIAVLLLVFSSFSLGGQCVEPPQVKISARFERNETHVLDCRFRRQ